MKYPDGLHGMRLKNTRFVKINSLRFQEIDELDGLYLMKISNGSRGLIKSSSSF